MLTKTKSAIGGKTLIILFLSFIAFSQAYSQNWSELGGGTNSAVRALIIYGGELIAGGYFTTAGGVSTNFIAKWNGSSWTPLGTGMNNFVWGLTIYGNDLIASGSFTTAGGISANRIAKWNGSSWAPLGSGMDSNVSKVTVYGSDLIAGGWFINAGGVAVNFIAKWNGSSWSSLGGGMNNQVRALTVYGTDLIAGGYFTLAGGVSANGIAKWNGNTWAPLGSGITSPYVYSLTVYPPQTGDLIAGGYFNNAGGNSALYIAKWNGSVWSPLGSGMNNNVNVLSVYGPDLIAGGWFTTAGGMTANKIARWNGNTWSPLGSGMSTGIGDWVLALAVYPSQTGDLIAGGIFTTAGGNPANNIAKWNDNVGIHILNENIPSQFTLYQNYPNPFNAKTIINFQLPIFNYVKLTVYDLLGREITVLVNEELKPGTYEISWDASDQPSGVYYCKLSSGDFSVTKKMIVIK